MKIVKLNKRLMKKGWYDIIKAVNAFDGKQTFPSHIYMSKEDIKEVRKYTREQHKKDYPYQNNKQIDYSESFDFLCYGVNSSLENVLKPGYVLVDVEGIEREIKDASRD